MSEVSLLAALRNLFSAPLIGARAGDAK
jgi:hypothetical protein